MSNGQCLCGAVTFQVDLPNDHRDETRYCYCPEYRHANGIVQSG